LTTPGQSESLTTIGIVLPFAASTKSPCAGVVLMYFGSPKAFAEVGHSKTAKRARTVVPPIVERGIDKLPV
jgi:hypothetical protein